MARQSPPPGLILAGGKSSRMGADKAFLQIGGDTILGHIARRIAPQVSGLVLNAPADYPNPLGLRILPDPIHGQIGPLAGVLAGLLDIQARGFDATHLITVPSDSPFVPLDFVARLQAASNDPNAIAIAVSGGQNHPVFGLWPVSIADDLQARLADPAYWRIKAFFQNHRLVTVEFPMIETAEGPLDPFFNINTPEDLAEARRFAGALA